MPKFQRLLRFLDKVAPAKIAHAHCDIPCGIYDPHHALMAAHTVLRMVNLINEAKGDTHRIARLTAIKEQHAEICKHEVRIVWGDYFKPEHVKKFPETHELVWKIMKAASKCKQEVDVKAAEELIEAVNKFAEIFWKTKGVDTVKVKAAGYPTEAAMVYPKTK